MSLGLSGAVLLVVAPLVGSPAAGATVRTVLASPSEIPGCDVDPSGPCEEPTPIVTVTVTEEPPEPQKTVTSTVIVPPKKTKAPKPTPTQQQQQETVQEPPPVQQTTAPPPAVDPPPVTQESPSQGTDEQDVQFPPNTPQTTPPPVTPPATPTETATFDDGSSGSTVYEIRNAGSEFDGATLSRQLGIPALILVLLVLFAVLIFEGRLRRLAHAAAIRRAGPRMAAGRRVDAMDPVMYPAGSAYVPAHYQSGTAYAPIISLVPMQMYGPPYPEGYAPEQYPRGYEQTTAYMPAPGYEQPGGYVDPYGRTVAGPIGAPGQDGSTAAFQGAPPPVPGPGERGFPRGEAEFPGAPLPQDPPRGGAGFGGPGGSLQDGPRDDFRPFGPTAHDAPGGASSPDRPFTGGPQDGPRPFTGGPQDAPRPFDGPQDPRPFDGPRDAPRPFGPEPSFGPEPKDAAEGTPGGSGDRQAGGGRPPGEPSATAVYPVQGQGAGTPPGKGEAGPDEGSGKKKRGLFRRSS